MSKLSFDELFAGFPPIQLTPQENQEFQSRRFGYSFLWVAKLESGRIIIGTPTRDPIAVVHTMDELLRILSNANAYAIRRNALDEREYQAKVVTRQVKKDEFDLDLDL